MAQAARVGKDHRLKQRTALPDCQQLVDLLLVLGNREAHLGVFQDIGQLVGDRVLVDRHRHPAQRLRRGDGPVERGRLSPMIASLSPRGNPGPEPGGQRLHFGGDLGPTPALPDAVIFLAHRRPAGPPPSVRQQHFREGVRGRILRVAGGGRHLLWGGHGKIHRCFLVPRNCPADGRHRRCANAGSAAPGQGIARDCRAGAGGVDAAKSVRDARFSQPITSTTHDREPAEAPRWAD